MYHLYGIQISKLKVNETLIDKQSDFDKILRYDDNDDDDYRGDN